MRTIDPRSVIGDACERAVARAVATYGWPGEKSDLAQHLRLFLLEHGRRLLERFDRRSSLETYISRVLEKQAITRLRSRMRRSRHLTGLDAAGSVTSCQPSIIDSLIEHETLLRRRRAASRALAAMAPEERNFICRCLRKEETMDEIAHSFGITRAAAYSRSHRLIERLRDHARNAMTDPIRSDPIRSGVSRRPVRRSAPSQSHP